MGFQNGFLAETLVRFVAICLSKVEMPDLESAMFEHAWRPVVSPG